MLAVQITRSLYGVDILHMPIRCVGNVCQYSVNKHGYHAKLFGGNQV